MPFDPSLWDNSDPTYAPGLVWGGRDSKHAYWVAQRRYVKAGYKVKRVPLGRGDKTAPVDLAMAAQCRDLTREMLRWYENAGNAAVSAGTWKWLIARYKTDEFSRYQDVKANTRRGYDQWLALVESVLGHIQIADTNYPVLAMIQKGKAKKGRSDHHIHYWFNTLRRVARHGILIEAKGAATVSEILSTMRIPSPAARSIAPTRAQIEAIVAASDTAGLRTFSLGVLIQYWFGLRAVDVRGQILDGMWADGLTWEMFSGDLSSFTKVISKTRRSLPEPYTFDLTLTPNIRQRLIDIAEDLESRSGPITISNKTGNPFTPDGWSQAWARCRTAAGVPKEIWLMDTRAGALTDASQMTGVTQVMLRNAGQHKDAATTGRYLRDRSRDANKVVKLRMAK